MGYRLNPDVVCTEICGKYLLIAARSQWERVPYVLEINEQAYLCWRALERPGDPALVSEEMSQHYGIPAEEIREGLDVFIRQLEETGYLTMEGTSDLVV